MGIKIHLETGRLKHELDGHYYNEHVLAHERTESVTKDSDMIDFEVGCRRCGKSEHARVHTDSEPHIWTIHPWLVGKFDTECDQPQRKIARASRRVINRYQGKPATSSLLSEMKDDIREEIDRPHARIDFV